jgi:hypothetical protein
MRSVTLVTASTTAKSRKEEHDDHSEEECANEKRGLTSART